MNTSEYITTAVIVVLVAGYLSFKSKKEKASTWAGELVKKKDFTDEDDENHRYRLIFKTNQGKKKKITVNEDVYNQARIGDKYTKNSGEYFPQKVS
jgi:hypothetical protein